MTTLYFSNCTLKLPGDVDIAPGRKVPQEVVEQLDKAGQLEKLIAKRKIVTRDPIAALAPKVVSTERVEHADWRFEVKNLIDKPLETLNMMIQDHVLKHGLAAVEPFTSRDEAIYWMGKDLPPKA